MDVNEVEAPENFKTTSGKTVTVFRDDDGEIAKVAWVSEKEHENTLSENEVYEIFEYVDSNGEDNDDD